MPNNDPTPVAFVPHHERPATRRDFLLRSGGGFGAMALAHLLQRESRSAAPPRAAGPASPLAAKAPHFPARAKSVIFLFMEGGPSHMDLFDPKPLLTRLAGQPLPATFAKVITSMGESAAPL